MGKEVIIMLVAIFSLITLKREKVVTKLLINNIKQSN